MVVLAEGTDLLAAATNVLNFFRNESCGKCVPCRVGSHKAQKILVEVLERGGGASDVDERIDELEETMRLDLDLRARAGRARPRDVRAADAARARLSRCSSPS